MLYIIVSAVAVLSGVLAIKQKDINDEYKLQQENERELKEKVESLKEEKKDIESKAAYVQTPQYIEDMAREKLGLVYEDEIIFEPKE